MHSEAKDVFWWGNYEVNQELRRSLLPRNAFEEEKFHTNFIPRWYGFIAGEYISLPDCSFLWSCNGCYFIFLLFNICDAPPKLRLKTRFRCSCILHILAFQKIGQNNEVYMFCGSIGYTLPPVDDATYMSINPFTWLYRYKLDDSYDYLYASHLLNL